jgi:hypothetical protein
MPKPAKPLPTILLDKEDEWLLDAYKWRLDRNGYLMRHKKFVGDYIYIHRQIMNCPAGMLVDHKNHNPLDNRKTNLRVATASQNQRNRVMQKKRSARHSKYKGVISYKNIWRSRIFVEGKTLHLGLFHDEGVAATAYDCAAILHYGDFAKTNFPRLETT